MRKIKKVLRLKWAHKLSNRNIARTYFYMDWVYPGHGVISKKNRKLFQALDKGELVDVGM